MADVRDLYQEVILEHSKTPRNHGRIAGADRVAEGENPLCGDECTVYLRLAGDTIAEVAFEGHGCAISKASASIMTTTVKGRTLAEAERLFEGFHDMVTGAGPAAEGRLAVFEGVKEFPARVKCATLAWHTLHAAMEGKHEPVSTE